MSGAAREDGGFDDEALGLRASAPHSAPHSAEASPARHGGERLPAASLPAPLTAREGIPAGGADGPLEAAAQRPAGPILASTAPCAPAPSPVGTAVAKTSPDRAPSRARTGRPRTPPAPGAGTAVAPPAAPGGPERPVMEIRFRCIEAGRRYYAVLVHGLELFVGTRPECDRFLAIHDRKVAEEQELLRRVPRGRPAQLRVFRTLRA